MEQSKIFIFLKEMSSKDKEKFRQFVCSPYFNQHQPTIRLLEILLGSMEKTKDEKPEKETLYGKVFPQATYEEQKMHDLLANLKKLYHKFLAYEFIDKHQYLERLSTIEEAYETKKYDLMLNRGKILEKLANSQKNRDDSFHLYHYRLFNLMGYYEARFVDRTRTDQLTKMLGHLDKYYFAEKLKNCCRLQANMMTMNTSYRFSLVDEIIKYIQQNWSDFENENSILVYYTIYLSLIDEKNEKHYQKLKELLLKKSDQLNKSELRELYVFATNYCISRIHQGESAYQLELFDLYKQGLAADLLTDEGVLSEWDYKNISTLGSSLKEFEWTEAFIKDYREKLPLNHRDNAYNYNLANLYYNKKLYNETKSVLINVQFTDAKYHLNVNTLLLKTYYALDDTEALMGLIETFRIYVLRSRKTPVEEKNSYTNFLRFARKLVKLKQDACIYTDQKLNEKVNQLRQDIEKTDKVMNKNWLLEECTLEMITT